MSFDIGFIKAETHTPEYLMHKYWARKPHNVIRECIAALTSENDTVLDPFCGSGVAVREAALLGRNAYGFDLNPAAVLISSVLIDPPDTKEFADVFERIQNAVFSRYGHLYRTADGRLIKYLSHRIIATCECGKVVSQGECKKEGKKLRCPHCGATVRFNLERLVDTELYSIVVENDKLYTAPAEELARQKELSDFVDPELDSSKYDFSFPENRRILAFKGITTASFFTKRNYSILTYYADLIWEIEDEKIRNCALLLLTATVAQCSRLIASRNNLSTGGPAWSVPGFWIPQEHLESNPFVHFKARLSKFIKALDRLDKNPIKGNAEIRIGNSLNLLNSDDYANLRADLIFLDPPYGDSVPYTEFSNIWNSFLKSIPCSDEDISVSDRIEKNSSWEYYSKMLDEYMGCFVNHLTEKGKLLITFNNNDMKAWKALIAALQNNGFTCQSVFYQIPAVISSKAQMSINSSYISDVYSVYEYSPDREISKDLSPLLSHLCFVANSREGKVSKTVLDREFIISWLSNNLDHHLLDDKESIIASVFVYDKSKGEYHLKPEYRRETELVKDAVNKAMQTLLQSGSHSLLDSYLSVCAQCERFGTLELGEFKSYISDCATEDGKVYGYTQMSIFDFMS